MDIVENINRCANVEDVSIYLDDRTIGQMCCIINKRYLDETKDPMLIYEHHFEDEMYLLYDARKEKDVKTRVFKRKDMLPDMEEVLQQKYPIIFSSLNFMGICFGYVCFYYNCCDSANYGRIPHLS